MNKLIGKPIYKRTATGAIQVWAQEIQGGKYRTVTGQQGSENFLTSEWVVCEPKNVGRANERSAEAQAIAEVESNYKKKLERDYFERIGDVDKPRIFLPMLAKDFADYKAKLDFGKNRYFSQPKLDGMRCIATKDGLFSRNGKRIYACDHIEAALAFTFMENPDLILDGELYNHAYKDDFNTIISAAKKQKPTDTDREMAREVIQYHVYDVPSADAGFSARFDSLFDVLADLRAGAPITFVPTAPAYSHEMLDEIYGEYLADGYEGQMIRTDTAYVNKRTSDLLKRKESIDAEFVLVDLEPGKGNWSGKAKRAILQTADGRTFGAGVTGTQEFCASLLAEKESYLGKPCTVRYFSLTPDGIPRFGRVKEFNREDAA